LREYYKYINVSGSKKIMCDIEPKIALAKEIGKRVVEEQNWILFNGGAMSINDSKESTAIDYFSALGAQEYLKDKGLSSKSKILTLHPINSDHLMHRIGKVEISKRSTPALRRFDLVIKANGIITIEGLEGLKTLLELSIAMNKPIIPIPCTGGASRQTWYTYENEILECFSISRSSFEYEILTSGLTHTQILAETVIRLMKQVLNPFCFVAMPYGGLFDELYFSQIAPAVRSLYLEPVRSDQSIDIGYIYDRMLNSIRTSRVVIADISGSNPNVMYELGVAHSFEKPVILICQTDKSNSLASEIPFDIHMQRVFGYSPERKNDLKNLIEKVLSRLLKSNW